jgi:hypothetical protein
MITYTEQDENNEKMTANPLESLGQNAKVLWKCVEMVMHKDTQCTYKERHKAQSIYCFISPFKITWFTWQKVSR